MYLVAKRSLTHGVPKMNDIDCQEMGNANCENRCESPGDP